MTFRPTSLVTSALVAALLTAGAATPANARPSSGGCPSGFKVLSVPALTAQGYEMPARVDDPLSGVLSYGMPGNGNGSVCGVELGGGLVTDWGGPVYTFLDDQLPKGR
jgi:hypothetical protein